MREISDEELVAGFQRNNSDYFEELVHRYSSHLYRFIYRILKDEAEAQDVVQETFLRVFRNISRYDPKYPFKTWIYTIAGNLSINRLKSAGRKRMFSFRDHTESNKDNTPSEEGIEDPQKNPEEALSYQQTYERVNQALDALNPRQKTALILTKLEGFSYREVAEIMKISLSSVESLIFRAKQKLQRELKEEL